MSKIRLQDLTPDVYYNTSRDFQFIGRLFDVVLNSVKVGADSIYNTPLSANSDERLIDLMTLTLGFKSRHHYNVKQLTSLCSAFAEVIRNKGNINSIKLAVQALLNAEGIAETFTYSFNTEHTVINLFIPQNLTDINLLKDLLNYILPAGMGCNIIREFKVEETTTTNITTTDEITSYQVNTGEYSTAASGDTMLRSVLFVPGTAGADLLNIGAQAGFIANSDIVRPATSSDNEEND